MKVSEEEESKMNYISMRKHEAKYQQWKKKQIPETSRVKKKEDTREQGQEGGGGQTK